MDIAAKITDLLTEKEEKIKAEIEAHARIIVIDKQVKSLRRALKDVEEILNPEVAEDMPVKLNNGTIKKLIEI